MFKAFKKGLIFAMMVSVAIAFVFVSPDSSFASSGKGTWKDLGKGYKVRYDAPHASVKDNKYHVHVNKGNQEIGSINMDGSKHDGKTLSKVPKKIVDKIKKSKDWANHKKKQTNLDKKKAEARKANINWLSPTKTQQTLIASVAGAAALTYYVFHPSQWKAFIAS